MDGLMEEFIFNPKYINALNDLKDKIYKWLQDNDKLAEETQIKNKVIGFLGEVLVVTELYDKFKDKLNEKECKWVGGQKKGYDIQLDFKDSSKPIKIQVKSTTNNKGEFPILKLKLGDSKEKIENEIDEEYKQPKPDFKLPKGFQDKIDEEIGKNEANFWILNDLSGMEPQFFILKKEEINQLLKDDYRGYQIERKSKESNGNGKGVSKKYNYGINKEGVLWFRLHRKWDGKYFKNKLEDSKDKWEKIYPMLEKLSSD